MTRYAMKEPVKAKHRRILGRLWCRYTCGTCGSRSGWRRPHAATQWLSAHARKSAYCATKAGEPR